MQQKRLLLSVVLFSIVYLLSAQNRPIDGVGNNPSHPEWGAANTPLLRFTRVMYDDRVSTPGGIDRPNPRLISNELFQQDGLVDDPLGMSAITWVWGQFIDHDVDLTSDNPSENLPISVPSGDAWMDPFHSGTAIIPLMRSVTYPGSGTSTVNPRQQPNEITSCIDASNVYGSDEVKADWLRSHINGKLKLPGNLLPFNTFDGGYESTIDPSAPGMANPFGADRYFVAGDVRANENILLTAFHTLFAREHNRQCDLIKSKNPDWTDDEIYHYARKMVSGFEQSITYNEWMPLMGIHLPEYSGYDISVNPAIMNVFSGAAYRQGHTLLTGSIVRLDNDGNEIAQGNTELRHAFFNPLMVYNDGGIDPLFMGMATQVQQDLDVKMVSDVRSFLFGEPGQGGLDLAAINIQRGRERGLPDFNSLRKDFGMSRYENFSDITANTDLAAKLESLYGDINSIDPWVGLLAEDHMPGKLFGPTLFEIMYVQFLALRDGDRFFYENDPVLTDDDKTEIRETKLIDIIMRNTDISMMQGDLFQAMPHDSLEDCGAVAPYVNIDVHVETSTGKSIDKVDLNIEGYSLINDGQTDENGNGYFTSIPVCKDYIIEPSKQDVAKNGLTTRDVVILTKHILSTKLITDPYALLSSDVNSDGAIDVFDIVDLRRVLLLIDTQFSSGKVWDFVNSDFTFANPNNPFSEDFSSIFETSMLNEDKVVGFIGYKLGDINASFTNFSGNEIAERSVGTFVLETDNKFLSQDEVVLVDFTSNDFDKIEGFQFTFNYNPELLEFINIEDGILNGDNYAVFENDGSITMSWNNSSQKNGKAFGIIFKALSDVNLSEAISINSRKIAKEAYNHDLELMDVSLKLKDGDLYTEASDVFDLYQNSPNPFKEITNIGFNLPDAGDVNLTISTSTGQIIRQISNYFEAGYNELQIGNLETGIYFYEISTDNGTKTKSLIVIE